MVRESKLWSAHSRVLITTKSSCDMISVKSEYSQIHVLQRGDVKKYEYLIRLKLRILIKITGIQHWWFSCWKPPSFISCLEGKNPELIFFFIRCCSAEEESLPRTQRYRVWSTSERIGPSHEEIWQLLICSGNSDLESQQRLGNRRFEDTSTPKLTGWSSTSDGKWKWGLQTVNRPWTSVKCRAKD